ncbi:hypothetical protein TBS_26210 [Thermobispora bispora]|jgi:hypothetical protein|uniref:CDP-alcohol phosphatidyltransferase n=1 Tax=Thermobispora bispora (strain ATCC 19993 / DSM 43833 / CBS 139.67 / JCM 10125 / KCTC 9307 / NBRC 14880 / R51) TaxID=469371 RepID=D6Y5M0_THEBD|nr:CDP-alcohol phosphatidyltransferase family protein [Thermobispora bispora]MBO2472705.1 hypothetical protein [Actinomycetales bacterium]MDI9582066.1 CDP-alcohol phosphatidyltransferase family protein [Thermobispora sp.]ADG87366.1 hypothetical protein Tbis_0640 [Thermobispora bispora DSM 43833]MBX6168373.1 CDP-alcohol phosphatidyltransferase family protein [Thermobispora bispora]QSI47310.1 CDP-alcohol phosphatidyltransferase family protein [Thermobispora bispora]
MGGFTLDDVLAKRKRRDSWWTVFLVDPLACRLTLWVANHTSLTPNALSMISLAIGLGSATAFAAGVLPLGAVLFYLSFMVDCMDGKLARLKGNGDPFGLWLDYVGDRLRVLWCALGLGFGEYARTGDVAYAFTALGVIVLDFFRYMNAPQLKRVKEAIRTVTVRRMETECVFVEDVLQTRPRSEVKNLEVEEGKALVDLQKAFHRRFPWYDRFRVFLVRRRVRTHVWSGIEFHAAVFVIAPLFGARALIPVAIFAGALLLAFEMSLVYRVWLATRQIPKSAPERERILV